MDIIDGRQTALGAKTVALYFLLITAIVFPLAWPVLGVWVFLIIRKARRRRAQLHAVASQPARLPTQIGAL
jgi:hypothetical protein